MKWCEIERARAIKLYREGKTTRQIADALGRSMGSVASAIHRHSKQGTGTYAEQEAEWRKRQLVQAGYSEAEAAHYWRVA